MNTGSEVPSSLPGYTCDENRLFVQRSCRLVTHGIGVIECVIRNIDVRRTPSELPGVSGQHEDVKPRIPGALKQRDRLYTADG